MKTIYLVIPCYNEEEVLFETSKRLKEDAYAKGKYDESEKEDLVIIQRVEDLAQKRNCSMSEISLAWLLSKVASPVVGATKLSHIDTACKACDLKLTNEDFSELESEKTNITIEYIIEDEGSQLTLLKIIEKN